MNVAGRLPAVQHRALRRLALALANGRIHCWTFDFREERTTPGAPCNFISDESEPIASEAGQ